MQQGRAAACTCPSRQAFGHEVISASSLLHTLKAAASTHYPEAAGLGCTADAAVTFARIFQMPTAQTKTHATAGRWHAFDRLARPTDGHLICRQPILPRRERQL